MFSRQQAFREAISCDVYAGYGTPYPCSDRDIYDTQQYSGDNERPFVSASQANDELIDHNDLRRPPLPHERDAIRRLVSALDDAGREPWHADLVIKAFLDLDIVLFGGVLRGNVCVAWGDPDEWLDIEAISGLDVNDTLGVTYKTQPGRAQILLNAEVTFLSPDTLKPFYSMFTTLLHEMCHAFETVHVRPEERSSVREWHGLNFGSRVHAVDRKAKAVLRLEAVEDGEIFRRCHNRGFPRDRERHRRSRGRRY